MSDIAFRAGLNVAGLTTGLQQAQAAIRDAAGRMAAAFKPVQTAVGEAQAGLSRFQGIIGGVSMAAFAASIRSSIREIDALNDAADVTGATIEELSSLQNTLAPYGVALEQITTATGRLVKAMTQADEESQGAGEAFKALGIQTRDANGNLRPAQAVLEEVAVALDRYRDGSNKVALVTALFGRQGAALIPMLKDLAQAQRQAATITTDQAAAAELAERNFNRLAREFANVRNEAANALIPTLNDVMGKLRSIATLTSNPIEWGKYLFGSRADIDAAIASVEADVRRLQGVIDGGGNNAGGDNTRNAPAGSGLLGRMVERLFGDPNSARIALAQAQGELVRLRAIRDAQRAAGVSTVSQPAGPFSDARFGAGRGEAPRLRTATAGSDAEARGPVRSFVDAETRALQDLGRLFEQAAATIGAEQADLLGRLDKMYFDGMIGAELYEGALAKLFRTSQTTGKDGVGELSKQLEQQAERWRDVVNPLRIYARQLEEVRRLADEGKLSPQERWMAENDLLGKLSPAPSQEEQGRTFNWLAATEAGFRRLFDAIREGSVSAKGVMVGAFELIYAGVSDALAKMAGRWVVEMLIGKAASIKAALGDISASAARAGAAAFAATAAIPYVGPALAPAAGAAAYSGAMSYAAGLTLASAKGGFDVPAWVNPLTQLHAREMVLPAEHADTIRSLKGRAEEGPRVQHNHVWNVQAWDAQSVREWLQRNGELFYPIAERAARNGAGPFRG